MKLTNNLNYLIIINTPNNLCEKLIDLLETTYKVSYFDNKIHEKIIFLNKYEIKEFIKNNKKIWNDSYKITIIRNTYDRFIYSIKEYQKINNISMDRLISTYSEINNVCQYPCTHFLKNIDDFSKFLVGYNLFSLQSDLVYNNVINYDYIIRFEDLNNNINKLFKILNINLTSNINFKIEELDFLNSENLTCVNKIFLSDIIIFRYDLKINIDTNSSKNIKKINFIIPFRDRHKELRQLYKAMKKWLKIPYHIYVINQLNRGKFNRGKLINIGFSIINDEENYYCTHDVDLIPLTDNINNLYNENIGNNIISIFSGHNKSLGGIVMFNHTTFKNLNGFSNNYQGWGCEDRDFYFRTKTMNLNIIRKFIKNEDEKKQLFKKYYNDIGTLLPRYKKNVNRNNEYLNTFIHNNNIKKFIENDGINTCSYEIVSIKQEQTIKDKTHILTGWNTTIIDILI